MTSWYKVLSSLNVFVSWERTRLREGTTAETQTLARINNDMKRLFQIGIWTLTSIGCFAQPKTNEVITKERDFGRHLIENKSINGVEYEFQDRIHDSYLVLLCQVSIFS
jgi:hypothetical protein